MTISNTPATSLEILWPDSPGYEAARCRAFNTRCPSEYPHAICLPQSVEEIQVAVRLAREWNKAIRTRSGGHSLAGWTLQEDSVLLDLVNFRHLEYRPEDQTVTASPTTTSDELAKLLSGHGRFLPVGHCGEVGLAGYLLQGGMGINTRSYGWACEYLIGLDVVTATGDIAQCNADTHADLFWAARGGGPEFPAIVTRFYLRTRPAAVGCWKSLFVWPASLSDVVVAWVSKTTPKWDDDTEPTVMGTVLPGPNIPVMILQTLTFASSSSDSQSKQDPWLATIPDGTLTTVVNQETSIEQEFKAQEVGMPHGCRYICDSVWFRNGTDLVSVVSPLFQNFTQGRSLLYWLPMSPTSRRLLPGPMAFSLQADDYLALYAIYDDPAQDDAQNARVQKAIRALEPHTVGTFVADGVPSTRRARYWSDETVARLGEVQRRWDSDGRLTGILLNGAR